MKSRILLKKVGVMVMLLAMLTATPAYSQKPGSGEPRQEKLLNGLKVLMWSDPAAADVRISIRVHSGSAFDPQGKEGVMQLLADNIFPTPASKAYFSEDLGGAIEVISNYDYVQINASAKPSEFLTLIETLAQAVSNPTIDKETTTTLKKALTDRLAALEKDPSYVADQAATKRLFGTFPYGRPHMGTVASLPRIDFADLVLAKERFLTADNATLAISGNFNSDIGFRAARRYFGAWAKSDKRIPSTFRQPDEPDVTPLEITLGGITNSEIRYARRGLSRNDKDFFAGQIFGQILESRAAALVPGESFVVSYHPRVLAGVVMLGYRSAAGNPGKGFDWGSKIVDLEFGRARIKVEALMNYRTVAERWLDVDTYKLTSVSADMRSFEQTNLSDVQRTAERLSKNPEVTVVVKAS